MIEAPCKDCAKRKLHCHSTCEEYISFRKKKEKEYEDKLKRIEVNNYSFDSVEKMVKRYRKYHE